MKLNNFIKSILPHCNTYPNVLRIIVSDYNMTYDFSNEVEFYSQISSEINEFAIKEVYRHMMKWKFKLYGKIMKVICI